MGRGLSTTQRIPTSEYITWKYRKVETPISLKPHSSRDIRSVQAADPAAYRPRPAPLSHCDAGEGKPRLSNTSICSGGQLLNQFLRKLAPSQSYYHTFYMVVYDKLRRDFDLIPSGADAEPA